MTSVLLSIGCVLLALLIAHWVRAWIKQRNATPLDYDDFLGI